MSLFILLRYKTELFRQDTLIEELEDVSLRRDLKNALNKTMRRNTQNFWKNLFRKSNKNYSRLSLSTWRYTARE